MKIGTTSISAAYVGATSVSAIYLGATQVFSSTPPPAFNPSQLFAAGEDGQWIEPIAGTVWTDTDATTPAGFTDSIARIDDQSGNSRNATQATVAWRPLLVDESGPVVRFDQVDDRLSTTYPALIEGELVVATRERGVHRYGFRVLANQAHVLGFYLPTGDHIGWLTREGQMSSAQYAALVEYFEGKGAGGSFAGVTSFLNAWRNWNRITSFPLLDVSSGTGFFGAWRGCSSLTSFPALDVSSGTSFRDAWRGCSSLTSFPLLDVSSGTTFQEAWNGCSSLTSFPALDVSSGTNFLTAWNGCSSLTSFPALDVSSGTNFSIAWRDCSSLTSFPLLDVSSGTNFREAWRGCSSLTSFPALDVSSGTSFRDAWRGCSSLTSFPLLDVSSGTTFQEAWNGCSSLTSFPALDVSSGTTFSSAWANCSSLTSFPPNMFDAVTATDFTDAFINTNLSQQSIDDILVSINTANTSSGTFAQSGGSAPSATGEAAITAMRSRGWTVTVTGGF
jgi:hypothetical protein